MHLAVMHDNGSKPLFEAAIRDSLAKIVASPGFANAVRSRRFLEFVIDRTLEGAEDELKEYTIAIEVFGRKDSYDSREHSAVRVEASRVRTRLAQYYETQGREDPLIIDLPKGRYVPRFLNRDSIAASGILPANRDSGAENPGNPVYSRPSFWIFAAVALGLAVLIWSFPRHRDGPQAFRYQSLTDSTGEETSPSITPDGKTFVYARREGRTWHIFLKTSGQKAVDLTPAAEFDNTQPSFSPDGGTIAFRSERDGGGIFVMSPAGDSDRRISDFGFNPAWSPDGKSIVCATEPVVRPEQRLSLHSTLWTIDVASRRTQQIYSGDAVQPAWSPSGKRIAFWTAWPSGHGMSRDIWTIAADGSSPMPLTSDTPIDWRPRWSPDGKFLYFLSDRDGAMNLWRMPVDENSGKALGPPEPQMTPSVDMSEFDFARSAPRMIYTNRTITGRLIRRNLRTGEVRQLVTMPPNRQPVGPDLSRDGRWLVFYSLGKQEALYVIRADGSELRQLTDDAFQHRGPRWSPDGHTIAFTGTGSGRREIWTIHPDGSELRQLTKNSGPEPIQAVWSPDGKYIAYNRADGESLVMDLSAPGSAEPQALAARGFQVRTWSPDGRKLVGQFATPEKSVAKIVEYDLATGQTREIGQGNSPSWAPDGRHILFSRAGTIWQLDIATLKSELLVNLDPAVLVGQRISPDLTYLYLSATSIESDLWMREPAR